MDNTDFTYEDICDDSDRNREYELTYIDCLADELISRLKSVGFVIQRYDSATTNSIYLKLDYGLCNSIRISDHEGKKYLKYRYNLIIGLEEYMEKVDRYIR